MSILNCIQPIFSSGKENDKNCQQLKQTTEEPYIKNMDVFNTVQTINNTPIDNLKIQTSNENRKKSNVANDAKYNEAQQLQEDLDKIKKEQGFIGGTWDGVKNFFGVKTGSEAVQKKINDLNAGKITKEEVKQSLEKYQEGQKQVVEVTADVVSGIAAGAMYAVALGGAVAAPFTGGVSLGLTVAAIASASAVGGAVKVGIKLGDAASGGREYSWSDAGKDALTGAINGPLAFATAGIGCGLTQVGAKAGVNIAKTAAKEMGEQVVIGFGKSVSKEAITTAAKEAGKNITENAIKTTAKEIFGKMSNKAIKEINAKVLENTVEIAAKETSKGFGVRFAYNTTKGALDGGVNSSLGSSALYLSNCIDDSEEFSFKKLGQIATSSFVGGFAFGGVLSSTGSLVGKASNLLKKGTETLQEKASKKIIKETTEEINHRGVKETGELAEEAGQGSYATIIDNSASKFPPTNKNSYIAEHHQINSCNSFYRKELAASLPCHKDPIRQQQLLERRAEIFEDLKELDAKFEELPPLEQEYTFYRGRAESLITQWDTDFDIIEKANIGDVVVPDTAYSYTAFKRDIARTWGGAYSERRSMMYEIHTPKGAKISCTSEHSGEALFPRSAQYKLLSKTKADGTLNVVLEYILPNSK